MSKDLENQEVVSEDIIEEIEVDESIVTDEELVVAEDLEEEIVAEDTDLESDDEDLEIDEDVEEDHIEEVVETKAQTMSAQYRVEAEDIDVQEHVDAMLQGQDLTEEFQDQVSTIFEAAVVEKINEKLEEIYVDYEEELQENVADIRQELSEKVDEYLSYVAKEFVKENQVAIESGLKVEIMESFMTGLKTVFEENYVDVPEEKVNLYGEALADLEEKDAKLNEQFEANIQLSNMVEELEKEIILKDVTEGLTISQSEKVRSLSEGLEYTNQEDMMNKITLIKDNYFPSDTIVESVVLSESATTTSVEDSPVVQEENKTQSIMDVYARALSKPKD